MNRESLGQQLPIGALGEPFHYFTSIGSTNDRAKELAQEGAPHGTLLVADEQTAGRGRWQRQWFTPPKSALALSLILRPPAAPAPELARYNGLAAVALAEALEEFGGRPQIKWPNDVLLAGKKTAGILVEAGWREQQLDFVIIGIGVNVRPESVPAAAELIFPATCVQVELAKAVSRQDLLFEILRAMEPRLDRLPSEALLESWNRRLAFQGEFVKLTGNQGEVIGQLVGVAPDGRLELLTKTGETRILGQDFVSLRPVDRNQA